MISATPTYTTIQGLLDAAIGGSGVTIAAHGAFWRTMNRDQFVAASIVGQQLIKAKAGGGFDADASALVAALEARAPFGSDVGTTGATFRRMPAGRAAMPHDQISTIRAWIVAGCPA
jgi:hypothetical protein